MYVAREPGDERAHKVVSHGRLPFEYSRRKVEYDVMRIIGENFLFVGAFPGIEILLDKRADVILAPLVKLQLACLLPSRRRDCRAVGVNYIPNGSANATVRRSKQRSGK